MRDVERFCLFTAYVSPVLSRLEAKVKEGWLEKVVAQEELGKKEDLWRSRLKSLCGRVLYMDVRDSGRR